LRYIVCLDDFIQVNSRLVKNTLEGYKTDLKQFDSYNTKALESLDSDDIEAYIAYLLSKGYKAKTINRKLVSLKKYLLYLNAAGKLKNNVAAYIEGIKLQDEQYLDEERVINSNEYKRLLNQAEIAKDLRAVALIVTLAHTGMRISEVIQLKGAQYKTGEVTVRAKGRKFRNVMITNEAIEAINNYRKERKHSNDDYIFINVRNSNQISRQEANKIISFYGGKARIKKTKTHPHAFRHLAGYTLTKAGLPIDQVATMLGHGNINTTKIYSKESKSELKRKSENAFAKAYA